MLLLNTNDIHLDLTAKQVKHLLSVIPDVRDDLSADITDTTPLPMLLTALENNARLQKNNYTAYVSENKAVWLLLAYALSHQSAISSAIVSIDNDIYLAAGIPDDTDKDNSDMEMIRRADTVKAWMKYLTEEPVTLFEQKYANMNDFRLYKKAIFMAADEFDRVLRDIFGENVETDYSLDGLSVFCYDNDLGNDDLRRPLSAYFGKHITSIHMDQCDTVGVWLIYTE